MNKNRHRIVFNSQRGQLMAVGETASSQGKSASGQGTRDGSGSGSCDGGGIGLRSGLHPLRLAIASALGLVLWAQPALQLAHAQIVADPSAPAGQRPTILPTANGLPQVNIQTPSAAGVSHNTYIQFDVNKAGVILNNSRTNVQTQLGGFVGGNPWLAGGAARVILNEVNSSNPSQLRGFVEVAGQRAEVIIANPAGINIDGGGFLNASRVTLTTGSPVINSGSLDAFRVQGGSITVGGQGLDTSSADYTAILARAVQVNAGIFGRELRVVSGASLVDANTGSATAIAGSGPAPTYAIDVASIGGMYAGKIFLVGTESGLGVRNAGVIAATGGTSSGDLVLQANGWLSNSGSLLAAGNLQATTTGVTGPASLITNSGTIYANGNAAVSGQGGVSNTGTATLGAQGNTSVQASGAGAQVISAPGTVIAAGLNPNGSLSSSGTGGKLTITADGALTVGKALAGGDAALTGSQLNLADSTLRGQGISLTALDAAAGGIDLSRADVSATGLLATSTSHTLRTDGATVFAGQLGLAAGNLSNVGGQISQTGTGAGSVAAQGQVNNTSGRVASNGNTTLNAQSLANQGGTVQTTGNADLTIATTGTLDNAAGGTLAAGGNASFSAASLNNAGKLRAASTVAVNATDIDNAATGEITAATTRITAANSLTNRGLIDGQVTELNAQTLTNTGTGRIYGDTLSIAATTLNNTPETIAGVTAAPVIAARQRLDIGATTVNNGMGALIFSAGTGAGANTALTIGGSLGANRQATGMAETINNVGGTIESLGDLSITAARINNTNPDFAFTVQFAPGGTSAREYASDGGTFNSADGAWVLGGGGITGLPHGGYYFVSGGLVGLSGFPLGVGKGKVIPPGSTYATPQYQALYNTPDVAPSGSLIVPPATTLWAAFGLAVPASQPPAGPKPTQTCPGTSCGDGDHDDAQWVPPDPVALAAWNAAAAPWIELQTRMDNFRSAVAASAYSFDAFRDYTQSVPSATITRSAPGRILSGGAMTLNARDALVNDQSQIVAGGALNITGQAVDNRARVITVNAQRTGTAYAWSNYNEGCGGFDGCDYNYDAYRDSGYVQDVPRTFNLDLTKAQGNTAPSSQGLASGTQLAGAAPIAGGAALPLNPNALTVPNNSLFHANPNPAGNFIVETDPRFANYRNWLGSDYMLNALGLDPALIQKRLGDGFYEQRLVNEQVARLTGQRFLANYTSEEVQYKALMDAGVTFAQRFQLQPGIALTAAQVAQLTSDIVWLVEQDVTVPDGKGGTVQAKALVPVVYVVPRAGDLNGKGVLLAGREVNINLGGDLNNSGTIAGRNVLSLTAENVQNINGRITGDAVTVAARNDINVTGGQIDAVNSLTALAGRDINITTTTSSASNRTGGLGTGGAATAVNASSNNTFSMTGIDRVAGLYVTGNTAGTAGTLVASAGRDLNVIAGVIGNNSTSGSTTLAAGNNINLATVATSNSSDQRRGDDDFVRDAQTKEVGSQIQAAGTLRLAAGNDLNARAATVQATGDLTATAGKDINLTAGRDTNSFGFGLTTSESDLFSSSSTKERRTADQDKAIGTSLGGKTVTLVSGKDINVQGSSVIGDTGTTLAAGRNIAIEAATNTSSSTSFFEKKESGLLDGGGMGITVGTREQSNDQKNRGTAAAASTVGAISGNVTLVANDVYKQVGSDVIAPKGDITIAAKTVDITEARETGRTETEQKFKQTGITLEVSSPILSAVQTAQSLGQAVGNTSDTRMQALGVAAAGLNGYNTYKGLLDTSGNLSPEKAASISINLSLGTSQNQSNSLSQSDTARGSTATAGGNLTIAATGAGKDSNLLVQGSTLAAANNVTLAADNEIRLLAARNEASQTTSNSSSSSSVGISYGIGQGGAGWGFSASASKSQGNGSGQDTSYTNTQVNAGNTATLTSGGDTSLIGAVVAANSVKATAGGNLNIQSLQDTSTYTSQQSSAGGSISFGGGKVTGGGISAGKSNIDSNYQSVNQTSGIQAGDGGFQVAVNKTTDLKGGVISSTEAAVALSRNTFTTGALSFSDIRNSAEYKGTAYGVSINTGEQSGKFGINGVGVGIGSDKGSASSVTTAGISGIAGNTAVRTGDAETGIQKIFDAQKVQREIDAQVQITQAFGKEATKAVGTYAGEKLKAAEASGDQAEIDKWKEGGPARVALHALIGGMSGGLAGATGAGISQSFIANIGEKIAELDIPLELKKILVATAGTAIGAAFGGTYGGIGGLTSTVNNYLTVADLSKKDLSKKEQQTRSLENNRKVEDACTGTDVSGCPEAIAKAAKDIGELRNYKAGLISQKTGSTNPDELDAQIRIVDGHIASANNAIRVGLMGLDGGNFDITTMSDKEMIAMGFAFDAAGAAGIRAVGEVNSLIQLAKEKAEQAKNSTSSNTAISDILLPDADFAGRGTVRPDLKDHLANPVLSGKQISGGHDMKNFESSIKDAGGTIVTKVEKANGIYEVQYQLPNSSKPFTKTVYDPVIYQNMPAMATEAAAKALYQYQITGNTAQRVEVNGVYFSVPVRVQNGQISIPTAYPVGTIK